MKIRDYFKKILWLIMMPFFPFVRDLTKKLGYKPYPKRQEYHLGYLTKEKDLKSFTDYLTKKGFIKNMIAWIDEDEILSLRLLENFKYQYHIRLFSDREIRGHYELTPEYSPFDHLHDKDTADKREEFKKILGSWLVSSLDK